MRKLLGSILRTIIDAIGRAPSGLTEKRDSEQAITAQRPWSRRRFATAATAVALLLSTGLHARAETYPDRPIRVIVAFAPGGIADIVARLIGQKLTEYFGQNVIIENRGGAGGLVGAKVVSALPADGYTLLVTTSAITVGKATLKNAVDPLTQLTPIGEVAAAPTVFAVNKTVTAKGLMEYVTSAKGGHITYSTSGVGTTEHLTADYIFKKTPNVVATHVPFAGGVETVNAVLGQHVDVTAAAVPTVLPFLKDGSLKVMAVASKKRNPLLPDVPTLAEAGFVDVQNSSWIALFGPPGLSADIVGKLSAEVNKAVADEKVKKRLLELGFTTETGSPAEFRTYLKSEVEQWKKIVAETGFKPN